MRFAAYAATAALFATAPAWAQSGDGGQSSVAKAQQAAIRSGDAAPKEHALGDWISGLKGKGIDLTPSYLAEIADVASGGQRQGVDYAHQIKLQADIDLETLAGWKGWSLHGTLL
ncbi:MAG TPA: hypothetical protein VFL92_11615, partial [Sphingomonas sp.]|nr:hypothetical protein [Sphingomonas sp.]